MIIWEISTTIGSDGPLGWGADYRSSIRLGSGIGAYVATVPEFGPGVDNVGTYQAIDYIFTGIGMLHNVQSSMRH